MTNALDLVEPEEIEARLAETPRRIRAGDREIAFLDLNSGGTSPWVWFHGSPGCRFEALLAEPWARAHDVRLIALDRPGLGGTSGSAELCVLSVTEDVRAVLDALGISRFSSIGGSGGGPYSLACAYAFADRLDRAVVTAPGGIADGMRAAAGWIDRSADLLANRAPWLLVAYFRLIQLGTRLPRRLLRLAATGVEAPFVRIVVDSGMARAFLDEVFRQGSSGAVDDFQRLGRFGFALEDIRVPVLFVQGSRDPFVPARQTRAFAARVPQSRYIELEGAGHGTAIFDLNAIMDALESF